MIHWPQVSAREKVTNHCDECCSFWCVNALNAADTSSASLLDVYFYPLIGHSQHCNHPSLVLHLQYGAHRYDGQCNTATHTQTIVLMQLGRDRTASSHCRLWPLRLWKVDPPQTPVRCISRPLRLLRIAHHETTAKWRRGRQGLQLCDQRGLSEAG